MRQIGNLSNENLATRLTLFLRRKGISSSCEVSFDSQTGQMAYQLWVHEEDRIPEALAIFQRFQEKPSDPAFDTPTIEQVEAEPPTEKISEEETLEEAPPTRRFVARLTPLLILVCSFFYFINLLQEMPLVKEGAPAESLLLTPIQAVFLYDLPPAIGELEKVIEKYQISPEQKLDQLSPEARFALQNMEKAPYWHGMYDWVLLKIKGEDATPVEGPLFTRIRQGEIWRLFTPCLLHRDLLHILFNMLWLWVLGRPIEQRIGTFRTFLLTLVGGILSNTIQYLMSGPFFLGYSGIVMALAGFIWIRERRAPWEGYPLNRSTILFLAFYIGAIFLLQFGSFLLQIFTTYQFSPNIANTAHIAGALIGALLARFSYFAQRVGKP